MNSIHAETLPIEKKHKTEIESIRRAAGHELSSHAFASLYLWQHEMELSLHLERDFFAVKCASRGDNVWFFPCGNENSAFDFISAGMEEKNFSLCYLREDDARWLEEKFPGRWELSRYESSDEYICDISEYLGLEGSKFAELRKRIRHIDKCYDAQARVISEENISDAQEILLQWRKIAHSTAAGGLTDEAIGETALRERELLEISGSILYLDGKPMAMFAGFPINDNTIDALIGKCTPDAPDYTVYYAMREYLRQCGSAAKYCNLEEDLGIKGIRMVKRKMRPVRKNEIWKAVLL